MKLHPPWELHLDQHALPGMLCDGDVDELLMTQMLTSIARKIAGIVTVATALFAGEAPAQPVSPLPGVERFYVGTYSGQIWEVSLNLATGKFIATNLAASLGGAPSFIAITPNRKYLYAVDENNNLAIAYVINPTNGLLTKTNSMPSGGQQPPFIIADKSGSNVVVANYGDGWVTVFPINQTNGKLGTNTAHYDSLGGTPAHGVTIDCNEHYLFVCDFGVDTVSSYIFNPSAGTLATNNPGHVSVAPNSGPRHMVFDPSCQHAYVICQNSFTIVGFDYNSTNGVLTTNQSISTLTNGMSFGTGASEIAVHPSGKFLYGSNRGTSPDTI